MNKFRLARIKFQAGVTFMVIGIAGAANYILRDIPDIIGVISIILLGLGIFLMGGHPILSIKRKPKN